MRIVEAMGEEWPTDLRYNCTVSPDEKRDFFGIIRRDEMS